MPTARRAVTDICRGEQSEIPGLTKVPRVATRKTSQMRRRAPASVRARQGIRVPTLPRGARCRRRHDGPRASRQRRGSIAAFPFEDEDAVQRPSSSAVRGDEDDGHSFGREAFHDLADLRLGADVDAARRLVQQEDARTGEQPLAEDDLAASRRRAAPRRLRETGS
jgi:hypothetical protein